jgi:hypothetical protein
MTEFVNKFITGIFFLQKTVIYKNYTCTVCLLKPLQKKVQTSYSLNMKFRSFFLFLGQILACLDPDPLTELNPDPKNTGKDDICGYLSLEVAEDEVPEAGLPVLRLDELVQVAAEGDQDQHHCHTAEEPHPASETEFLDMLTKDWSLLLHAFHSPLKKIILFSGFEILIKKSAKHEKS